MQCVHTDVWARGGRNIFSRHRCLNLPKVVGDLPNRPPPTPGKDSMFNFGAKIQIYRAKIQICGDKTQIYSAKTHLCGAKIQILDPKFKYIAPKFKYVVTKLKYIAPKLRFLTPNSNSWIFVPPKTSLSVRGKEHEKENTNPTIGFSKNLKRPPLVGASPLARLIWRPGAVHNDSPISV